MFPYSATNDAIMMMLVVAVVKNGSFFNSELMQRDRRGKKAENLV